MNKRLGVVMDPVAHIHYKKDSTLSMLWEAQARGYELYYIQIGHLFLRDNQPKCKAQALKIHRNQAHWNDLSPLKEMALSNLDIILMRKDPPFDERYFYSTFILEQAEKQGVLVVNKAQALRDLNEKIFATNFPQISPPTLIAESVDLLYAFWKEYGDIVVKPLDAMGGKSIFRLRKDEVNVQVIFETLTKDETTFITAQKFIPEITAGDKRILFIGGEVVPHVLARVPQGDEWRGNLAVGAKAEIRSLTPRDQFICDELGAVFSKRGLYFVGIDVIGDYLTEINITSPTGIRELEDGLNINISAQLFDVLEKYLA